MIEGNIKDLKIRWVGDLDWKKFRDFLILKMSECDTEERFNFLMEGLLGSMFKSSKEMDETRKKLRLKLLSDREKKDIDKFVKEGKK